MIKKELLIFIVIFVLGALIIHPDLIISPLKRMEWMNERENYYHPFVLSLTAYLLITSIRLIIVGVKKVLRKSFKN